MKTHSLLRSSAVVLALLCLSGCDTVVIMQNDSSASVYILAPGEAAGLVDPLGPGETREAEVAEGATTFTALDENGEVLATAECEVPSPATEPDQLGIPSPVEDSSVLRVTWTGSQITCEVVFFDPESAGGGTAGRAIPRGVFWPPAR